MIRRLICIATTIALFVAGYWMVDVYEQRRIWHDVLPPDAKTQSGQPLLTSSLDDSPAQSRIKFEDIAAPFGLDFSYYDGADGAFYIVETVGGGMAVLDFDEDGNQDIFLPNGARLPVDPSDHTHVCHLFRNRGEVGFEDVSALAGVELVTYGTGATAADYDNDGFDDLLVTGFGRNVLYHSNGDGTFHDVTESAGVHSPLWGTSAALADLDRDGNLDLYVCTYAYVSLEHPLVCEQGGRRIHCVPSRYRAQPDLLFRNGGDGRFTECGAAVGIADENGRGLGIAIADLVGNDDLPDIFVANDTSENFLFVNEGGFHFEDKALSLGVALSGEGSTMSGMGVACADYDRNGALDLLVTNFYHEKSVLYKNMSGNGFIDSADAAGLGTASRDRLGFGAMFLDANLDGLPDLFVANGHVSDMEHLGIPYKMRQQFFQNHDNGTFRDISDSAGSYFHQRLLGRGVAAADINNDGLPDLIVSHIREPAALLLNRTTQHGHWLGLRLVGTRSNRSGLNAKIQLSVGGELRSYEIVAGGGYLSSSDKRLSIGLGQADTIDDVVVRWPSDREQRLESPATDSYHTLIEATSR